MAFDVIQNHPLAILVVETESDRIIDANVAALSFYGWNIDTLRTMVLNEFSTEIMEPNLYCHRLSDERIRDVEMIRVPVSLSGKVVHYCIINDVTERRLAESEQAYGQGFHQLIMKMAPGFSQLPVGKLDNHLQESLTGIAEFVQVDRAYIFRYDFEAGTMSNTHEWCAPGVPEAKEMLQNVLCALVPGWVDTHKQGKSIIVPNVSELPDTDSLRRILEAQEIKTLVTIPLMCHGECFGFVGFDEIKNNRAWRQGEIAILSTFAELLATAEHRIGIESALSESETKYQSLYRMLRLMSDTMPDMMWGKDLEKRYLFANKAICTGLLSAVDTEEPLGKTDLFFAQRERKNHPEDRSWHTFGELCQDSDAITIEAKEPRQFDEYGNVKGQFLFLDVRKAPLFDESGRLIGVVGSARDVTSHKRAEEALRDSEAKYRAVVDQAWDGVLICDPESGLVIEGNSKIHELLGYRLPEDGPLRILDLFVDEPKNVLQYIRTLDINQSLEPQRRILRHRNGTHVPVLRTASVIQYQGRRLYSMTVRDVSHDIRREQEVLRDAAMAQRIQEALLPPLRSNEYVDLASVFRAYMYVGGDLYFTDWRADGRVLRGFLVDTMGHGLGTALHGAALHVMLRDINETDLPLVEQVRLLNRRVAKHFDEGTFAAAIAFELDFEGRTFQWVCAGIPDLWAATSTMHGKISSPGMFLGIRAEEHFQVNVLHLQEGDCLYLCTDGMTDLLNMDGDYRLGDWRATNEHLRRLTSMDNLRDDAMAICIRAKRFPQASVRSDGWPRIMHLEGYGDYQRRRGEIVRIIATICEREHSYQEVAVNEAIANALECRDGVARPHRARVRFNRIGRWFVVRIRTSRIGFAGNAVLARLRSNPESAFEYGGEAMMGRGISLMFALTERMTYNEDGNEVLLAWKDSTERYNERVWK